MDIFSKKTLLSAINGGGIYGAAPTNAQTVKFAYTENIVKIGTAGDGVVTFYADTTNKTGIVAIGDQIVSSKIFDVTSAAKSGGKTGENTITVTYFNAATKEAATTTFDVVNAAAAKAYFEDYFATSNTIDVSNGVANVRVDGATILVDSTNGLKSGLNIAYIAESGSTGATIALRDNSNTVLSSIEVSDIVGDGVLKDSIYHQDTNILELRFGNGKVYNPNDPTTYTKVEVNLQKLIDINDVFIGNDSSIYLDATLDASTVTLNTKMQDPSTADDTHTGLADAWKVKQYVDSKSTDLAVSASGDNYVDASVDANDNKHINVAATDKTKTAVALAETAVQSVVEGTSTETYVGLTVSTKSDASVITITTDDSSLSAKITEIDGSIGDISTRLFNKTTEIDASIDRLDSSVSAIETQIAAMDADISTAVALDAANGIYVRGTLTEADGVVTTIGLTSKIADTSITRYNKAGGINPAWELNEDGLLNGDAATKLKNYVDDVAAQLRDEAGAVDTSLSDADGANFISIHEEQENGAITKFTVDSSYGVYDYTAGTHTFGTPTDGIAKVADTQTFVQTVVESLDLANNVADASAIDASSFVKTTISETNGIVKNESVEVTYAAVTAAPGSITVNTNGIVKGDVLKNSIESALTWTVLE